MTVSTSPRLGLTRWSAGGDPVQRSQFDDTNAALEELAAGHIHDDFADLPAATALTKGFLFHALDTGELFYGTGTAWILLPAGAGNPVAIGTAIAQGISKAFARADHVHNLGAGSISALTQFAATLRPVVICTSGTHPAGPVEGQPIWETDTNLFLIWDGAAWINPAPPGVEIQAGTNLVNNAGGVTINFPDAFSAEPVVVATVLGGGTGRNAVVNVNDEESFTVSVRAGDGTGTTGSINWIGMVA